MRKFIGTLVAATLAATASGAAAGWNEFCHRCSLDFHRNNAFPQPFNYLDRESVANPFVAMTENGWRQNNTVSGYFFDPETNALTRAGKMKIEEIVTQGPQWRQGVFVVRGDTPEATRIRLDEVQRAVARALPEGALPQVAVTDVEPRGLSAREVDLYTQEYFKSRPQPVLPAGSGGGGGEGGEGSGS